MRVLTLCVVCGALLCGCSTATKQQSSATTTTVVADTTTTTTTVVPVPTTLPTTTTKAKPRPTTPPATESPAPEPQVQGTFIEGDDLDEWRAIAMCEMPGPGGVPSEPWGAHWSFKATWSGAFGIYNPTWLGAGGGKYGPTAGHATWQQQIEIARVIRDRYGYRAWGCGRKLGLQ